MRAGFVNLWRAWSCKASDDNPVSLVQIILNGKRCLLSTYHVRHEAALRIPFQAQEPPQPHIKAGTHTSTINSLPTLLLHVARKSSFKTLWTTYKQGTCTTSPESLNMTMWTKSNAFVPQKGGRSTLRNTTDALTANDSQWLSAAGFLDHWRSAKGMVSAEKIFIHCPKYTALVSI